MQFAFLQFMQSDTNISDLCGNIAFPARHLLLAVFQAQRNYKAQTGSFATRVSDLLRNASQFCPEPACAGKDLAYAIAHPDVFAFPDIKVIENATTLDAECSARPCFAARVEMTVPQNSAGGGGGGGGGFVVKASITQNMRFEVDYVLGDGGVAPCLFERKVDAVVGAEDAAATTTDPVTTSPSSSSLPAGPFESSSGWDKVLLPTKNGAVCLDGSPGGYYRRRGGDAAKWVVFMEGGGWCGSDTNCVARSATVLGSSKQWGPTYTDTYEGSALFNTAPFNNYTVVFVKYCDGSSFTSNVTAPVAVGGSMIYYRGRLLLDALLDDLLGKGLAQADTLLYAGCSAGALTTYVHADYVAGRMPASVRTLALADAMFSLNSGTWDGKMSNMQSVARWGFARWNATASINPGCVKNFINHGGGWQCMFGANVAPYVKTPTFVLNSKYDSWQKEAIIGANCDITNCAKPQRDFWVRYGNAMVAALDALPVRHGVFVANCQAHCQTGPAFLDRSVNGTLMKDAFVRWYKNHLVNGAADDDRWIDRCDVVPCGRDQC
jgi:hypothetical protein